MKRQLPEIQIKRGRLFTTSLDVAEKFGKRHDHVLDKIRAISLPKTGEPNKEIELFSRVNFVPSTYIDDRGKEQPMLEMSRAGLTILAMGFTGQKAILWKIKYEKAFSAMEQTLLNQKNLLWQENRKQGKITRLIETNIIQQFIAYAESQGSKNAHFYYITVTAATYKALFIVTDRSNKKLREVLDAMQLSFLQTCEYVAAKALSDGMEENLHYKDIFKLAKKRILAYAETVGVTRVISSSNMNLMRS